MSGKSFIPILVSLAKLRKSSWKTSRQSRLGNNTCWALVDDLRRDVFQHRDDFCGCSVRTHMEYSLP